ncbi:MAG: permease prefix domain 1-containing protein [Blastocatellia bacterium]
MPFAKGSRLMVLREKSAMFFDKLGEVCRRVFYYLRRDRFDRELREEMDFHLYMTMKENPGNTKGCKAAEARYAAERRFGNRTLLREVSREMWGVISMETLLQDIRYACRLLLKKPGFAVAAIATLATGIGLNSAIFSVVNSYILRPMPYKDGGRLVQLWENVRPTSNDQLVVSPANFADWRKQASSFESISLQYLPSISCSAIRSGSARRRSGYPQLFRDIGRDSRSRENLQLR